jgi:hypothetical protein
VQSPPDTNRLKEDLPALAAIIREFKVRAILVNGPVEEDLKSRAISSGLRAACPEVPEIINTSKAPKQNKTVSVSDPLYHNVDYQLLGTRPAIILVSFSADMHMTVSKLTHTDIVRQCNSQIIQNRMLLSVQGDTGASNGFQPSCRPLIACVRTFSGLGFLYATALGVHMGAMTILLSPFDYFVNPQLWFEAVHKYKVKDAFTTYPMLEHAMNAMSPADYRSFSLNNLENLMIMTEGRLRIDMRKLSCFARDKSR